ncbi:ribosomal protein S5 domain 2-type protein [Gautieria morchelliformis]|nr:ribosomal protein S5 domain 2-type protein [Gautieria morchelliformis]
MTSKSESSYIQSALLSDPPCRADGRALLDYRALRLTTGVAALANGSARLTLGGTTILAACKLEIEDIEHAIDATDGRRISCAVSCSPAAYPHHAPAALDELQHDLAHLLNAALAHAALRPANLTVLPGRKAWLLSLDCVVLADAGNVHDALFLAARAALCDTRVPVTRPVEYRTPLHAGGVRGDGDDDSMGMGMGVDTDGAGLDTRHAAHAADFELADYWSEGAALEGWDRWPVCVTLNLISTTHFLDATPQEEAAVSLRLLLLISCAPAGPPTLHGTRLIGSGELPPAQFKSLVQDSLTYAKELKKTLDAQMHSERARRQSGVLR